MRHLTLSSVAALSLLGGCIVYDNECPYSDGDHSYGDHDYDNGGDDVIQATYELTPGTISPGEVIISSLVSDMALDYETIVEVEFTSSQIRVCTTTARDDELLITIGATDSAAVGFVDLVITFEDGSSEVVQDALEVVSVGDDPGNPNDGSGGGSGGSGDTGDGTSGGSGDTGDGTSGGSGGSGDDSICG
jgi:uncharacterized membrane protein YgcG